MYKSLSSLFTLRFPSKFPPFLPQNTQCIILPAVTKADLHPFPHPRPTTSPAWLLHHYANICSCAFPQAWLESLEFFKVPAPAGKFETNTALPIGCPIFDNFAHWQASGFFIRAALGVLRGSQQPCKGIIINTINLLAIMLVYFRIPRYTLSGELYWCKFIHMTEW